MSSRIDLVLEVCVVVSSEDGRPAFFDRLYSSRRSRPMISRMISDVPP